MKPVCGWGRRWPPVGSGAADAGPHPRHDRPSRDGCSPLTARRNRRRTPPSHDPIGRATRPRRWVGIWGSRQNGLACMPGNSGSAAGASARASTATMWSVPTWRAATLAYRRDRQSRFSGSYRMPRRHPCRYSANVGCDHSWEGKLVCRTWITPIRAASTAFTSAGTPAATCR